MKTINVYRFNELSLESQETAIEEARLIDTYAISIADDFESNHGHMVASGLGYQSYNEYLDVASFFQGLETESDNYYNAWYTLTDYCFSINEIQLLVTLTPREKMVLGLVIDELTWSLDNHGLECESAIELPKHVDAIVQGVVDALGHVLSNANDELKNFYSNIYYWNYSENMIAYFQEDEYYWFTEDGTLVDFGE